MTGRGYLTVAEVGERFGFSPRTVLRWVERGDLAAVRFPGGRIRISETALEALEAAGSTTTPTGTLAAVGEPEGGE